MDLGHSKMKGSDLKDYTFLGEVGGGWVGREILHWEQNSIPFVISPIFHSTIVDEEFNHHWVDLSTVRFHMTSKKTLNAWPFSSYSVCLNSIEITRVLYKHSANQVDAYQLKERLAMVEPRGYHEVPEYKIKFG